MNRCFHHLGFVTALLALGACSSGSSTGESPEAETGSLSYIVSGNRIITKTQKQTMNYCIGTEMKTKVFDMESDTVAYVISGNTLTLTGPAEFDDYDAKVEIITTGTRMGSGSGLEGRWLKTDEQYRVVSGDLDAELEARIAASNYNSVFVKEAWLEFKNGKITYHADINTAAQFADSWKENEKYYDISAKIVDQYTIELVGNKTQEIVRIGITPSQDRTYSSNRTDHKEHQFQAIPKTCPNEIMPKWFQEFQSDNMKLETSFTPLEKAALSRIHSPKVLSKPAGTGFRSAFSSVPLKSL